MNSLLTLSLIFTTVLSGPACTMVCPSDLTKSADENCLYKLEDLTGLVTGTCSDISQDMAGGYLPVGEHTMTFTDSGETCTTNVVVVDDTPPTIRTIKPDTYAFTNTGEVSEVYFSFSRDDNCCGITCNVTLVSYEDMKSEDCEENRDDCECDGKISTLTFRNDGNELEYVVTNKDDDVMFSATVANGEEFTVNPLAGDDDFGSKIYINGVELHTSCSQDIYITMEVGDLVITYGESRNNGKLCSTADSGSSDSSGRRLLNWVRRLGSGSGSSEESTCLNDDKQATITGDRTVDLCIDTLGECYQRVYTITGMCLDSNNQYSTKTTTVSVTPSDYSKSDPTCDNGIMNGKICCASTCMNSLGEKQCGGDGCYLLGDGCCAGTIISDGLMCSVNQAPCLLY